MSNSLADSSSISSPLLDRASNALIGGGGNGMVPSPQSLQMVPTSSSHQIASPMNLNMNMNMNMGMGLNMNLNGE